MGRRLSTRLTLLVLALAPCLAPAGGGPENVLLVVNPRSFVSLTLGNYYARARQIPPSQVLYLDWTRDLDQTDVAAFRELLLGPALTAIQQRGLSDQIDYLIYSSDFPTAVNYEADLRRAQPGRDKAVASLTALTYLHQAVMDGEVNAYTSLTSNAYFQPSAGDVAPSSRGFRSSVGWLPNGLPAEQPRPRYLLSTMLSVTSGRGISLRDSVDSLRVSATADSTAPPGVIYFMVSENIRSKVRAPAFLPAITALKALGVEGVTMPGVLPLRRDNIAGAVLGNESLPLAEAQLKILPGAICENLTSTGAMFTENSRQTACTELLRFGAAGSSGTVTEPYAIQQKFPTPFIQVHYARGCSLAEAFYQAVQGPFQLLIVGDPLCRPWAKPSVVELAAPEAGSSVRGTLELRPTRPTGAPPARWQLFVDGRRWAEAAEGEALRFDTATLPDGFHELRTVAIEDSLIATQSRKALGVMFDNQGRSVAFTTAQPRVAWGQKIELDARSDGATSIDIRHGGRSLGLIGAAAGKLTFDPRALGLGPVTLQAVALGADQAEYAVSPPLALEVGPGSPLPAQAPPAGLTPGICVIAADGQRRVVPSTVAHKWLEDAGIGPNQAYQIEAWFEIAAPDVYQFQVRHAGQLELQVDGQAQFSGQSKFDQVAFVPVVLAQGAHRLTIRGTTGAAARLNLRFGGPGALHVAAPRFSCER